MNTIKGKFKKINWIGNLRKKFKFKIWTRFFISIARVTLGIITTKIILSNLSGLFTETSNYKNYLLPQYLQNWLGLTITINKPKFILIGLFISLTYFAFFVLEHKWEEELKIKGKYYVRKLLLDKLFNLSFEEKKSNEKEKVLNLLGTDAHAVGQFWEHTPNHTVHVFWSLFFIFVMWGSELFEMNLIQVFLSIFYIALTISLSFALVKKKIEHKTKYWKMLDEQWEALAKITQNLALIDNMGLAKQFISKQYDINRESVKWGLKLDFTEVLNNAFPDYLILPTLPFIFLIFNNNADVGVGAFWEFMKNIWSVGSVFKDYSEFKFSCRKIDSFLRLPEKDDNILAKKIDSEAAIKFIHFQNISFRYMKQKEMVLDNYNKTFTAGEVTYLSGANGSGKSTTLYLLLGVLKPISGQIKIELENGLVYDLNEINLEHWRANNVAYAAHDTLIEEGSTGQKQLANINNLLVSKSAAKLWIFDEATNGLDVENQIWVKEQVLKLTRENKLVIFVLHESLKK